MLKAGKRARLSKHILAATTQPITTLTNATLSFRQVVSIFILGAISNMATASGTTMNDSQLDAIMTGNTIYFIEPESKGEIVLWYASNGVAKAKLPSGNLLDGTWSIKDSLSCIVWSYSPKDSCSKLVKSDNQLALLESGSNRLLGTVKAITTGNTENL